MGKGDGRSQEVFGGKVRVWGGPRGAGAASGQRRRGGWVRAGEGSAQGLRRATARAWGREVRMAAEPQLKG